MSNAVDFLFVALWACVRPHVSALSDVFRQEGLKPCGVASLFSTGETTNGVIKTLTIAIQSSKQ